MHNLCVLDRWRMVFFFFWLRDGERYFMLEVVIQDVAGDYRILKTSVLIQEVCLVFVQHLCVHHKCAVF